MNTGKHSHNSWIGNGVLAVAMLALFFMGPLSDALGIWAAVLWMALAAVGMALVMSDKREEPPAPDSPRFQPRGTSARSGAESSLKGH